MRKGRIRRTLLKAGVVGALTLALLAVPVPWTSLQLDETSLARAAGGEAGSDAANRGRVTPVALHSDAFAGESEADRRRPQQSREDRQAPRGIDDIGPAARQSADNDRGSFESIGGLY